MKPAIEKIIDFVTITALPNNAVSLDLSPTGLTVLFNIVSLGIENVRTHLTFSLYNLNQQSKLESLVQNYQLTIIKLLNEVYLYKGESAQANFLLPLYDQTQDLLSGLLSYLKKYAFNYFNLDEQIPFSYYSGVWEKIELELPQLKNLFKDSLEDLELIELVLSHYSFLGDSLTKKTITFRDLIYQERLFFELKAVVSRSSIYNSMKEILLQLNFNNIQFFKWLVDKLQNECKSLESVDAKLEGLKYQQKLLRQTQIVEPVALFSPLGSIKDQVLSWIDEEIAFMERQIKAVNSMPELKENQPIPAAKIIVALSVAQLAFFIRVLTIGKVITNNNQSDVIRIFASNFKTHKTEDISYGSLYGKYFKPETSAIREVKGLLFNLTSIIAKMKE